MPTNTISSALITLCRDKKLKRFFWQKNYYDHTRVWKVVCFCQKNTVICLYWNVIVTGRFLILTQKLVLQKNWIMNKINKISVLCKESSISLIVPFFKYSRNVTVFETICSFLNKYHRNVSFFETICLIVLFKTNILEMHLLRIICLIVLFKTNNLKMYLFLDYLFDFPFKRNIF